MTNPGNGSSINPDTEDMSMDVSGSNTPAAGGAASEQAEKTTGRRSKARKKRRLDDDDGEGANATDETPLKKTRLHSPEPVIPKKMAKDAETAKDDEMKDAAKDDEMEEAEQSEEEIDQENEEAHPAVAVAAVAADAQNDVNADQKVAACSKAAPGKKGKPPLPNLRVPSHQTPGKFARDTRPPSTSSRSKEEIAVPTRQLVFGNTPTAASVAALAPSTSNTLASTPAQTGFQLQDDTSSSTTVNGVERPPIDQPEPAPPVAARGGTDAFAKSWVWFLIFAFLTLVYGFLVDKSFLFETMPPLEASIVSTSDACLDLYKRQYYKFYPPPTREVTNQTRVQEIKEMRAERQRQKDEKTKLLKQLDQVRHKMQAEIDAMILKTSEMKRKTSSMKERVRIHEKPVLDAHKHISFVDSLLKNKTSADLNETLQALPDIKKALGESDRHKVLDLSSLDLWEIPEMPEDCLAEDKVEEDSEDEEDDEDDDEEVAIVDSSEEEAELLIPIVDRERLVDWAKELRALIETSTGNLIKDDEASNQVRKWIRSELKRNVDWDKAISNFTIKEAAKQLVKKEAKGKEETAGGAGSSQAAAIKSQIEERLELAIADQTGQFDFASIRNGAVVVRQGPRATSRSLAQSLPFVNRLLAHVGLRFYGHGAEAALTPTYPPDSLGQCWAFLSEEGTRKKRKFKGVQDFSRGSFATLTVRLAKPVFVHSVVIEHPPLEVSDRKSSAIRVFRIVGYEDRSGSRGSFELGRFEFKPENGPRAEFEVARKLSRQDVPKLRSIALAIESTWGNSDDYGCLYRFRVHGDDNE